MSHPIYDAPLKTIQGEEATLRPYAGEVLLIVNTASGCGFTPQYAGLQALHARLAARGLRVLGFPCDQFGHQEPGTEAEIYGFCQANFGVTFPMFSKIEVNGAGTHPLFAHLKAQKPGLLGERIKWNFTKFLVSREGEVLKRFASITPPEKLAEAIEAAL